jgi:hypothetical protein
MIQFLKRRPIDLLEYQKEMRAKYPSNPWVRGTFFLPEGYDDGPLVRLARRIEDFCAWAWRIARRA